jgi:hypothetical protein
LVVGVKITLVPEIDTEQLTALVTEVIVNGPLPPVSLPVNVENAIVSWLFSLTVSKAPPESFTPAKGTAWAFGALLRNAAREMPAKIEDRIIFFAFIIQASIEFMTPRRPESSPAVI